MRECAQWARERAVEGAGHARAAGLQAETRVAERTRVDRRRPFSRRRRRPTRSWSWWAAAGFSGVKSILLGQRVPRRAPARDGCRCSSPRRPRGAPSAGSLMHRF